MEKNCSHKSKGKFEIENTYQQAHKIRKTNSFDSLNDPASEAGLNPLPESPVPYMCTEEVTEWCSELSQDATPNSGDSGVPESPMPPNF